MNMTVGGEDVTIIDVERGTVEAGHLAAGFAHDQHACRHIPGFEMQFPECLEAAQGGVAQVEGRVASVFCDPMKLSMIPSESQVKSISVASRVGCSLKF